MSAAKIRKAIAALTLTKNGVRYRPPLLDGDSPEEMLQEVRTMLGFLQSLAAARAEIELHSLPGSLSTQDYIATEHMLLGMLQHALVVAEVLIEDEKAGGARPADRQPPVS
ncbi:MAG: hypothetical protein AB7I01_01935 [Gammaproteobacteria bacterium]